MNTNDLNALKQQAITEPNVTLRAQYAQTYAKALESVVNGEQALVKADAPDDLAKGAVDAVGKVDKYLRQALSGLSYATPAMGGEWDDSGALVQRLYEARDIIVEVRQKLAEKKKQYQSEKAVGADMRKELDAPGIASAGYLFQRIAVLMGVAQQQAANAAEVSTGALQTLRDDPESIDLEDLRSVAEDAAQSVADVLDNAKSSKEYADNLVGELSAE